MAINNAEPQREQPHPERHGSVVVLGTIIVRHLRSMLTVGLASFLLVFLLFVLKGPTYTATLSFAPTRTTASASRLAGLAAQFGVDVGSGQSTESVAFYATLVKSREILQDLAITRYMFATNADPPDTLAADFIDLLGIEEETPHETRQQAIRKLDGWITATTNQDAGLVVVEITAPWPELAEKLGRHLLELVNEFNLKKRQSQAGAERVFVEERLRQAGLDLREGESELARFLQLNRRVSESPQLQVEMARLQRQVDLRQQVYVTLAQSLEQARLEQVRNTPVITVVDQPEGSARRDIGIVLIVALATLIGGVVGIGAALFLETLAKELREAPGAFAEFRHLRDRPPLRFLRKVLGLPAG